MKVSGFSLSIVTLDALTWSICNTICNVSNLRRFEGRAQILLNDLAISKLWSCYVAGVVYPVVDTIKRADDPS
jgi:hypothetical protein